MKSQEELLALVEQAIVAGAWKREPVGLYEPIEYVLSLGGKRIRPCLILMACNLFTEDLSDALNAALALEVFHNFTLLHDDIMDKAETRRGYATVHKRWNENTAILSGDAMLIESYRLLDKLKTPRFREVLGVFNTTADEVCKGQQYDMEFENRMDVTLDEYMEMIRLKTAVLLAGSLKIGALIGGATDVQAKALYDFGINMGLAFQLQDDYLDAFGDPNIFGKAIGGDILCGKKCFLMLSAYELAKGVERERLENLMALDSKTCANEKIAGVIELYRSIEIDKLCQERVNYYTAKASDCLRKLGLPDEKLETINKFAGSLSKRRK